PDGVPPPNTCGLWCCARLINKDLSEEQFFKRFKEDPLRNNDDPDLVLSKVFINAFPDMELNPYMRKPKNKGGFLYGGARPPKNKHILLIEDKPAEVST